MSASAHLRPSLPSIELVVAASDNDVIGRDNQLPWRLSDDLKRFKSLTIGKPVLMGRKTYQSIGKALPGRLNLVMSRTPGFAPADATVVASLEAALDAAGNAPCVMVIGGAEIYSLVLPFASRIHLTRVHAQIEGGDAFFSGWRQPDWVQRSIEDHAADSQHTYSFSFVTLERASSGQG